MDSALDVAEDFYHRLWSNGFHEPSHAAKFHAYHAPTRKEQAALPLYRGDRLGN
jgi:hypothetical protein